MPRNCDTAIGYVNFDFHLWMCGQAPFVANNSQNRPKSNHTFPGKEEKIGSWFVGIWIAQWLKFFPTSIYFFEFGYPLGETGVKIRPKAQTLGTHCFCKNLNFSEIFKTYFFSAWILLLVNISAKSDYTWGILVRTPTPWKKKRVISWTLNWYIKLWKLLTWQPQMLCW